VGGRIGVHGLGATGPSGVLPVQNAEFRQGLAHWLAVADGHFLPWHTDSLYLELLVERGLIGLCAFLWLCAGCMRASRHAHRPSLDVMALQVAIGSMLLLGLLISVMEFTRVAFLLQFMLFWASLLGDVRPDASS
jgi:O-antigen ligase